MFTFIKNFKPGVPQRIHRIVAASIWSVVGVFLMLRGSGFLLAVDSFWLGLVGVLFGTCKSLFLLDKSARKNLTRLNHVKDGSCLGGVYSLKMWILVGGMIFLGIALRKSPMPREIVGVVYVAIGWGLFFSSRLLWKNVS